MTGMNDTGVDNAQVVRRHYVFALRGELPIPEPGWTVTVHSSACAEPGSGCRKTPDCRLTRTVFLKAALVHAPTLTPGATAMSGMVNRLTGKDAGDSFAAPPIDGKRLLVAVTASAPIDVDPGTTLENHFNTCFNLACDSARALQQVTGDPFSPAHSTAAPPLLLRGGRERRRRQDGVANRSYRGRTSRQLVRKARASR